MAYVVWGKLYVINRASVIFIFRDNQRGLVISIYDGETRVLHAGDLERGATLRYKYHPWTSRLTVQYLSQGTRQSGGESLRTRQSRNRTNTWPLRDETRSFFVSTTCRSHTVNYV